MADCLLSFFHSDIVTVVDILLVSRLSLSLGILTSSSHLISMAYPDIKINYCHAVNVIYGSFFILCLGFKLYTTVQVLPFFLLG